jgi:capsular polysaccharide biosynthesis protein
VVLNRNRTVAKESINIGDNAHAVDHRALCTENVIQIDGPATLLRAPGLGYYHAQVDNLPRLALLHQLPWSSMGKIKLLRSKSGPAVNYELEDHYVPRIAPPNCQIIELDNDALYAVDDYIFLPFLTRMGGPYIPPPYIDHIRAALLPDRPSTKSERIYISRAKASRRHVANEGELMDTLAPYGFEKYYLEDLHIGEKVDLFYDAECVISPHGAGLTSSLFCKGASVLELFPTKVLELDFYMICQSVGLDHYFWKPEVDRDRHANFRVDVKEVQVILDEEIGLQKIAA